MTQATDFIQTLRNEWPAHAGFFSTWASVGYFIAYPTDHLMHAELTADQDRKIAAEMKVAMNVFNSQPAKDLFQEIKYCNQLDYILKKIYEDNPALDKRKFEKISAQLEQCSLAAFEECEHEYGGIPLLGRIAEAYVNANTKESWRHHIWWISKCYKYAFAEKAMNEVSQDNRRRFELLVRSFKVLTWDLFNNPSLTTIMEQLVKNEAFSEQAVAKSQRITLIAYKALLNRPSIQEGFKMFEELAGFILIQKFDKINEQ
jgi:hypothetical protein